MGAYEIPLADAFDHSKQAGSPLQILIDPLPGGRSTFLGGDHVTGTIKYNLDKDTPTRGVRLTL